MSNLSIQSIKVMKRSVLAKFRITQQFDRIAKSFAYSEQLATSRTIEDTLY